MKTVLTVHADYRKAQIPADDIAYITVEDRKTKITRGDGSVLRTNQSLKDVFAQLPEETFLNINRGIVVSKRFIQEEKNGEITMTDGRYEEAIRLAKEALQHNEDTVYYSAAFRTEALLLVARCTMELQGDFQKALDDYQAAYQDQGLGEFYRITMAEYYIDQGDLDNAKREMDSIARLSEATKPAYLMLQGRMELKDNQYEQAAKQLEKAEQLARTTGSNYFMSGLYAMLEQCYREMEDFKKAYHYASMQLQIKE